MEKVFLQYKDLLKTPTTEVLRDWLEKDLENYQIAQRKLLEKITLLDDAIALFMESIQGGYQTFEQWKDNPSNQAAVIMANSTLNLLLLCRHSVLLGYYPETLHLLRGCHERITRCYLFFLDADEAKRFLDNSGKPIGQKTVDNKISRILDKDEGEKQKEILEVIRKSYRIKSGALHPNIESMKLRTGGNKGEDSLFSLFRYPLFAGLLPYDIGESSIFTVIQTVLFALLVIDIIFIESSGKHQEEHKRIRNAYEQYLAKVRKR
jgi:hypothetical protein